MHDQTAMLTSVSSMHCFCMSLATISIRGRRKTYLRSSLINSASSKKHSSMPWKAAAKHGSRAGFSVTGFSHICNDAVTRVGSWQPLCHAKATYIGFVCIMLAPRAQLCRGSWGHTFCKGVRWMYSSYSLITRCLATCHFRR